MSFVNGGLPAIGLAPSETSQSTTMIPGSNALGEVIPPHFQFSTNAKSDNCECIWLETVKYLKGNRGKFVMTRSKYFLARLGSMKKEEWVERNLKIYL